MLKRTRYFAGPRRALEDERGERFDQVRTRADHAQRIFGRGDTTRADEDLLVVEVTGHQRDDLERARQKRSAGDSALTQVVVNRRVRGDDTRQAEFLRQLDD